MRMIPASTALAFLLLLPACVSAPDAPRPQQTAPRPTPAPSASTALPPPAPVEWQYRPATPGTWSYRTEGAGSAATFSSPASGTLLSVRCDPAAGRISFLRAGAGAGAGQGSLTIRTSFGAVSWPATSSSSGTLALRAASDTVLDQIAYSRGRFAVEAQGLDTLILPAWAELGRVIEDCRR